MRRENEEERHDERGAAALALHGLRGVDGQPLQARRRCRAAVVVPRLAFVEEDPRRDGAARPHVQSRHLEILEDMAGQPRMRRDPPRRPRRRHLDQTQVRRADRAVRRRKRRRVAPRAQWPSTRVQRCTFHAFEQVKRCTTTRPRTPTAPPAGLPPSPAGARITTLF